MTKKISLSLLVIAVLSIMVSSASLALFTATTSNIDNSFASGDVTLDESTGTAIQVNNIAPGDSGSGTYSVTYVGSLDAWLGVDIASSGGLFTCDGANSLQVSISDGANSYALNGANQVVGLFDDGDDVTLTTSWSLPLAADDDCENQTASISLEFHAVQARNNTNATNNGPNSWSN